jgi:hypothetical protein
MVTRDLASKKTCSGSIIPFLSTTNLKFCSTLIEEQKTIPSRIFCLPKSQAGTTLHKNITDPEYPYLHVQDPSFSGDIFTVTMRKHLKENVKYTIQIPVPAALVLSIAHRTPENNRSNE